MPMPVSTQEIHTVDRWQTILIALLLLCSFFLFLGPIADGDFFWHLKTGEWIWQHKMLPQTDPFSAATMPAPGSAIQEETSRFILRGYWLAQVLFFGIWEWFGPAGVIILRALLYTGIVALILFWTKKKSPFFAAFIAACLLADLLREFPGERPQIITFLFTPLTLYLLEQIRTRPERTVLRKDLALPLLMLLWPQLHGGYVLGVALIIIYLLEVGVGALRNKAGLPTRIMLLYGVSLLATFLNPNTYHVIYILLASTSSQTGSIQEYLSPVTAAMQLGEYYPAYFLFLIGAAVVLLFKFKTMERVHIAVVILFGGLSLTGLRYMPYFLMTAPLVCRYVQVRRFKHENLVLFLVLALWVLSADKAELASASIEKSFPRGAVSFIHDKRPEGGIFNYYGWGGYVIQYLPEYPAFIDGRGLHERSNVDYDLGLWSTEWERVFHTHHINVVLIPALSLSSGEIFPLAMHLLQHNEWFLVFKDDWSVVFARQTPQNQKIIHDHAIKKTLMYDHILAATKELIRTSPHNPGYWRARATAQLYQGDLANAAASYRMVLKMEPNDERSLKALKIIGQESLRYP